MSRIGNKPIEIPKEVDIKISGQEILVSGPKGKMSKELPSGLISKIDEGLFILTRENEKKQTKASHGTYRALIANMVVGVTQGFDRELELVGTGYRVEQKQDKLVLTVGFSHPVEISAPKGISFEVEKTKIIVKGVNKELVGQVAAKIRAVRPPEPYKGKGIKYIDEVVRRKPGKAAKAQAE